jgi:uncharacterized membrane protein
MKDLPGKITSDRKILYPLVGAVLGVVVLVLITVFGEQALYVLLAIGGGALIGHFVRKFGDEGF